MPRAHFSPKATSRLCHLVHLTELFRTLGGSWSSYPQKISLFFSGELTTALRIQGGRDSQKGPSGTVRWALSARKDAWDLLQSQPEDMTPAAPAQGPPTPAVWGGVSWLPSTGDTASVWAPPEDTQSWAQRPGCTGAGEKLVAKMIEKSVNCSENKPGRSSF